MKTLYLECNMGAAGDMLMAALLELIPDADGFLKKINGIGIPKVKVEALKEKKCGISGTRMQVRIDGEEEGQEEHTGHTHHHTSRHHSHRSLQEILQIIGGLQVEEAVKEDVRNIYQMLAEAESRVHGEAVAEIHFHEVGMLDAIADITGCAMLLRELKAEQIIAGPINVGFGQVHCAHGILPVPAPATAVLLNGMRCYVGGTEGELCTPTGAAILKYYVQKFGQMPDMTITGIGYGLGKKDFEAANCVRALLGETGEKAGAIEVLNCNMDDMTPEEIAFATELLMQEGALDVFTTAIGMKKGRPGILLTVMCRPEDKTKMAELLFRHTSTIGIRESLQNRMVLDRRQYLQETEYGEVRMKECTGYGVTKRKPEFEDLKRMALEKGLSLRELKEKGGF